MQRGSIFCLFYPETIAINCEMLYLQKNIPYEPESSENVIGLLIYLTKFVEWKVFFRSVSQSDDSKITDLFSIVSYIIYSLRCDTTLLSSVSSHSAWVHRQRHLSDYKILNGKKLKIGIFSKIPIFDSFFAKKGVKCYPV